MIVIGLIPLQDPPVPTVLLLTTTTRKPLRLAGNLLGGQTLTQHMGHQLEALATRQQLSHRSTHLAAGLHLLLGYIHGAWF